MEFRLRTSGVVATEVGLKNLFPTYDFPNPIPDSILEDFQLDVVWPADPPTLSADQTAVRNGAVFNSAKNRWEYSWRIVNQTLITFNTIVSVGRDTLIKKIDSDIDFIYGAVLGNRSLEYAQAESEAKAFVAANYEGDVPPTVDAWAKATGHAAQWAADDIAATSIAWREAQSVMRAKRLYYKELARKAVGVEALIAITEEWELFRAQMLKQLVGKM